jgi:PadR family transcriptional regulator, regulatory protein PadR
MARELRVTDATLDVLEVLLTSDLQLYGLKIAKAINRPTGSVFPILARLERIGWVSSEWEASDPTSKGPRRRFYRLSGVGMARARTLVSQRRPTQYEWLPRAAPVLFNRIGLSR